MSTVNLTSLQVEVPDSVIQGATWAITLTNTSGVTLGAGETASAIAALVFDEALLDTTGFPSGDDTSYQQLQGAVDLPGWGAMVLVAGGYVTVVIGNGDTAGNSFDPSGGFDGLDAGAALTLTLPVTPTAPSGTPNDTSVYPETSPIPAQLQWTGGESVAPPSVGPPPPVTLRLSTDPPDALLVALGSKVTLSWSVAPQGSTIDDVIVAGPNLPGGGESYSPSDPSTGVQVGVLGLQLYAISVTATPPGGDPTTVTGAITVSADQPSDHAELDVSPPFALPGATLTATWTLYGVEPGPVLLGGGGSLNIQVDDNGASSGLSWDFPARAGDVEAQLNYTPDSGDAGPPCAASYTVVDWTPVTASGGSDDAIVSMSFLLDGSSGWLLAATATALYLGPAGSVDSAANYSDVSFTEVSGSTPPSGAAWVAVQAYTGGFAGLQIAQDGGSWSASLVLMDPNGAAQGAPLNLPVSDTSDALTGSLFAIGAVVVAALRDASANTVSVWQVDTTVSTPSPQEGAAVEYDPSLDFFLVSWPTPESSSDADITSLLALSLENEVLLRLDLVGSGVQEPLVAASPDLSALGLSDPTPVACGGVLLLIDPSGAVAAYDAQSDTWLQAASGMASCPAGPVAARQNPNGYRLWGGASFDALVTLDVPALSMFAPTFSFANGLPGGLSGLPTRTWTVTNSTPFSFTLTEGQSAASTVLTSLPMTLKPGDSVEVEMSSLPIWPGAYMELLADFSGAGGGVVTAHFPASGEGHVVTDCPAALTWSWTNSALTLTPAPVTVGVWNNSSVGDVAVADGQPYITDASPATASGAALGCLTLTYDPSVGPKASVTLQRGGADFATLNVDWRLLLSPGLEAGGLLSYGWTSAEAVLLTSGALPDDGQITFYDRSEMLTGHTVLFPSGPGAYLGVQDWVPSDTESVSYDGSSDLSGQVLDVHQCLQLGLIENNQVVQSPISGDDSDALGWTQLKGGAFSWSPTSGKTKVAGPDGSARWFVALDPNVDIGAKSQTAWTCDLSVDGGLLKWSGGESTLLSPTSPPDWTLSGFFRLAPGFVGFTVDDEALTLGYFADGAPCTTATPEWDGDSGAAVSIAELDTGVYLVVDAKGHWLMLSVAPPSSDSDPPQVTTLAQGALDRQEQSDIALTETPNAGAPLALAPTVSMAKQQDQGTTYTQTCSVIGAPGFACVLVIAPDYSGLTQVALPYPQGLETPLFAIAGDLGYEGVNVFGLDADGQGLALTYLLPFYLSFGLTGPPTSSNPDGSPLGS